jgi:hypothetical protein
VLVIDVPASSGYGLLYQLAAKVGTWDDARLAAVAPVRAVSGGVPRRCQLAPDGGRDPGAPGDGLRRARLPSDPDHAPALFQRTVWRSRAPATERGGYVAVRAHKLS